MKVFKHIALSIFLTLGIFCAVFYISCQKDVCKGVTCLNKGNCSGGTCICATGIGGNNCETVYRELYAFPYKGVVSISGKIDSAYSVVDSICYNHTLVFIAGNDTVNYNNMQLAWNDSVGKAILSMDITLSNNSPAGSDFTVSPFSIDSFAYSGSGSVSTVSASLNLKRMSLIDSSTVIFTFNSFNR